MKRQFLTDDSGRWFDLDKAESWEGRGDEQLYKTPDENFILQWGDAAAFLSNNCTWGLIEPDKAYKWLASNGHAEALPPDELEKLKL